ncbi:MAG TPA: NEW3 domain-containing protein [Candidatus Nanoarchaeia archaeon]|nr:NEW3 domain-containing protein [Candidatus Nanoarchaeia archaeon]
MKPFFLLLLILLPATAALEINTTHADGTAFHMSSTNTTPRYNRWNASHTNFDVPNPSLDVGGSARWEIIRANHEREEYLAGTLDVNLDVNIQFFNGTTWYNLTELTTSGPNAASRFFDIAVEQISGEWLVAYENSNAEDNQIAYRTLNVSANGTIQASAEQFAIHNIIAQTRWIKLVSRPRSDDIMLMLLDNNLVVSAQRWNGTAFDSSNLTLTTLGSGPGVESIDFAWEGQAGDGIAVYSSNNQYRYRNFTTSTGNWSNEALVFQLNGGTPQQLSICSEPSSDYIGMIFQDNTNDVNVRVWNGSVIESTPAPPTEDSTTESSVNARTISCFWNNEGNLSIFAFADQAAGFKDNIKYTTYNKTAWNVSNLENATTGPDDLFGSPLRGFVATPSPMRNETIISIVTTGSRASMLLWNGTSFGYPSLAWLQNSTSCTAGQQHCAAFDWNRFDPPPTVRNVSSNASVFPLGTVLNISANITDNLNVSEVHLNVTFPNASTILFSAFDEDHDQVFNGLLNVTDQNGRYNYTVIANDSSTHQNVNATESSFALIGDAWPPNVTFVRPLPETDFDILISINISANVTDNIGVDQVIAQVTFPNSTTKQFRLINQSAANFSGLLNDTSQVGQYNVTIIANDTTTNRNNVNDTETTMFNAGDSRSPTVLFLLPLPGTNIDRGAVMNLSANVTDETALHRVRANVTVPNGSTFVFDLFNSSVSNFTALFNDTSQNGFYNITIIANDTSNNRNDTEQTNFSAGDVVAPSITLLAPTNNTNTTSTSISVDFLPLDDKNQTLTCTANVNGTLQTNSSTGNGSSTTFTYSALTNGTYSWNVSCGDGYNTNVSGQQRFTVDTDKPTFISLITDPSSTDALDPGVTITAYGNVTDASTAIDSVVLQYRLLSDSLFTNLSMSRSTETGLWNASFIALVNGTYILQMFAIDTVGNSDTSQNVTRAVQYEQTWNRTPERFVPVGILKADNGTLGNLVLNNSGDFPLNFSVSSDYQNTSFNVTFPQQLSAGEVRSIQVNVTAPGTAQVIPIVLTISASPDAIPAMITTNATIVVTNTQPFLAATVTTAPSSVLRGENNIEIVTQVQNVGTASAQNITLLTTIPSDWVITSGDPTTVTGELNINEVLTNTLVVSVPVTAALGPQQITANATGVNSSGADLTNLSLTLGERKIVTVTEPETELGGSRGGGGSQEGGGGGNAPNSGGSSGPPPLEKTLAGKELLETRARVELTRGEQQTFPLAITNVFADTVLYDMTVEIGGYLKQYVSINPPMVTDIKYGETKYVYVTLAAPAYKDRSLFDLLFIIKGRALAKQQYTDADGRQVTVNTVKDITERRTVTLVIHEFAKGVALSMLKSAEQVYAEFVEQNIPAKRIGELLATLNAAYANQDYGTVKQLSEAMADLRSVAFAARDALAETDKRIAHATVLGMDTPRTGELLLLARTAYEREDFTLAVRRAREAQAAYLLETQARFDTIGFLRNYWWQLILSITLLSITSTLLYRRFQARIITHRLRNLEREEENIHAILADLQKQAFGDRSLSLSNYQKLTKEYEKRIIRIQQIRIQLRTSRAALLSPSEEEHQLRKEYTDLQDEMVRSQTLYLKEKKLSRYHFFAQAESQRRRLAELERERLSSHIQSLVDARNPQRQVWNALQELVRSAEREGSQLDAQARGTWRMITEHEQDAWRKLENKVRPRPGIWQRMQEWLNNPQGVQPRTVNRKAQLPIASDERYVWKKLEDAHHEHILSNRQHRWNERQRERLKKLRERRNP